MTSLTPGQVDAVRALRAAFPDAKIAIIGAAALGHHIPMPWRTTADLDLVATISVPDLENVPSKLRGWERDPMQEQRWHAPNKVLIDLVPVPPDALMNRRLIWPGGREMGLGGIRLALEVAPSSLATDLSIAVASVPVVFLLKMAAYLDRPDREKDLQDLAHILDGYPPDGHDRLYEEDVMSRGLDEMRARAYVIGTELRALVDKDDREIVDRFLEKMREGPSWGRFVAKSPWRYDEDKLRMRLDAFEDGFGDAPPTTTGTPGSAAIVSSISLTFVVNGEEVKIDASPGDPLLHCVERVLERSKNTGRKPEDWELRHENGTIIADLARCGQECGVAPGDVLYLTLKVGAGGHASRRHR